MNGLKKTINFRFSRRQRRATLMTLRPSLKTMKYVEDGLMILVLVCNIAPELSFILRIFSKNAGAQCKREGRSANSYECI